MIYFKKVIINGYTQTQLEFCIRKASIKRTLPLDMDFTSMNIGTDKFFLARQEEKGITFTRIKTSFEKILPKLISNLLSDSDIACYKIRLSTLSTAIFLSFTLLWLLSLTITTSGNNSIENFLIVSTIYAVYLGSLSLEYKFTTAKVDKAVKLYNK